MDIISYNIGATANGRIESFIENPDSTSGVVTVPKVIASGETITIPTGRMAILPNVQIDGTLDVQGEVFIPSGATMSKVVEKVTSTDNAVVRFNGTTGEVQNSGVIIDDSNNVGIGTSTADIFGRGYGKVLGVSSSTTTSALELNSASGYSAYIDFGVNGTRTLNITADNANPFISTIGAIPLSFATNGIERMRIDANGNVGIGVTPSAWYTGVKSLELGLLTSINQGQGGEANFESNSYRSGANTWNYKVSGLGASRFVNNFGQFVWYTAPSGTAGSNIPWTNAMVLASNGNLLVGTTIDNGVDKLQVNGSIKCSNGSKIGGVNHSIVVYNGAMNYPATAIHFKFNYRPLTINKMICLRLSGYNYGSAESFNATVSCYVYTGTAHLHSLCTTDSRVNFYVSSDGYLTLKVALTSAVYYPSFVIDSILTPSGFVESSNLVAIVPSSTNI